MDNELQNWRKQIDFLDKELPEIVSKRVYVVREIGKYKRKKNLPPLDEKRWKNILESQLSKAEELEIPKDLIKKIYTAIHESSLKIEESSA